MELKFILLGFLAGIFLIAALPVGIVFLVFTLIYYYASKLQNQDGVIAYDEPTSDDDDTGDYSGGDDSGFDIDEFAVQMPSNPDYRQLFDGDNYIREQEKYR